MCVRQLFGRGLRSTQLIYSIKGAGLGTMY